MINVNYNSLYIFCVSLGVIFIVVPFIFPLMININNFPILAYEDFLSLSKESKDLFIKTQKIFIFLIKNYLLISSISIVIGIILLRYGLVKWRHKQETIDEKEKIDLIMQGNKLENMSIAENDRKLKNEDRKIKHNTKSEFNKIKKFEIDFYEYLQKKSNQKYLNNIKISNYAYDIINITSGDKDVVYEIKHWYDTPSSTNLIKLNKTLAKMKEDYFDIRKKKIEFILIIDSLGKPVFDYEMLKNHLTEISEIQVYGNNINDILANIKM